MNVTIVPVVEDDMQSLLAQSLEYAVKILHRCIADGLGLPMRERQGHIPARRRRACVKGSNGVHVTGRGGDRVTVPRHSR